MRNRIYIRADGNPKIGLGHIMRCFALAKMLKGSFKIHFVTKSIPVDVKGTLEKEDFSVVSISSEGEFFKILKGDEIVVIDHYGLDTAYQQKIKEIGSKLVCIDDLYDKEFYADLIINHAPGITPGDYMAQSYTDYALGPEYALLRPAFLRSTSHKRDVVNIRKILICFGGSDFKNLTKSVLSVVVQNKNIDEITVILGSAYKYQESLTALTNNDSRLRVLSSLNEKEILKEIKNSDLAIIPSSGILLEVIAGGAIPLICYYAENQKKLFHYFKNRNLLPTFNANDFKLEHLNNVIDKIQTNKINMENTPFREEIGKSSTNNLLKFKALING